MTGRANRRGRVSPFSAEDVARFWKWRTEENLSYREIAERQGAKFHQIYYIMQGKGPVPANGNGATTTLPGETEEASHVHSTPPATPSATAEEKE